MTSSLYRFLKNLIGKDVTRISMPVHFNEPLSFTQVKSHDYHMTVDEYFFLYRDCVRILNT